METGVGDESRHKTYKPERIVKKQPHHNPERPRSGLGGRDPDRSVVRDEDDGSMESSRPGGRPNHIGEFEWQHRAFWHVLPNPRGTPDQSPEKERRNKMTSILRGNDPIPGRKTQEKIPILRYVELKKKTLHAILL